MQHAVYDHLKLLLTSPHSISSLLPSCDITTLSGQNIILLSRCAARQSIKLADEQIVLFAAPVPV